MFLILEKYQWISLHNRSTSLKSKILDLSHWFLSQSTPLGEFRRGGSAVTCPQVKEFVCRLEMKA